MFRLSFLLTSCLLAVGCSSSVTREQVVGTWSSVPLDEPHEDAFTFTFMASGEFEYASVGSLKDGNPVWRSAKGKWRLEGNTLTIDLKADFKLADPVLKLVRVTDSRLEYRKGDGDGVYIMFRKH